MAGRTVGRDASRMGFSRLRACALAGLLATGCMTPTQPYNQRGVALFKAGQVDAARAEFLQATYADPSDADSFYNLGSVCHRCGRSGEAECDYNQCLALAPNHSKCRHALVVLLLEQNRPADARAAAENWMNASPGQPDPIIELAWLQKQSGHPDEARGLLQQAIAIDPRHPRALAELASLYENAQEPDRALVLYQRALGADPQQPELARRIADLRASALTRPGDGGASDTRLADGDSHARPTHDLRYEFRR